MIKLLKSFFGIGPKINYKELINNGAIIIDVRTQHEFLGGHIKDSINIPLQNLNAQLSKLDKNKTIITCCASGIRSASARSILKSNGFADVYNGGAWHGLENKI
jgi:phage shock protein E